MRTSRRFLLATAVVVSLGAAGIVSATGASAEPAGTTSTLTGTTTTVAVDASDDVTYDDVVVDDGDWSAEDEAQWMAESNAETADLSAYLTAHGIVHTVTTDADGWTYVDYDWDDQAASDAVDDFYWERYPMAQEDIDAINADAQALTEYLNAHGIEATLVTDRHGLQQAEYDMDDEATWDVVDDYYWEQSPWTQEEIDLNNADAQALTEYLNANGIEATLVTDRHGLQYADYEWTDAADEAVAAYYGEDAFMTDGMTTDGAVDAAIAVG